MKFINNIDNFNWYLKYFGLPLTLGVLTYGLFERIKLQKRKASLRGKVVIVTGASSGIGEALAHAFYDQGCKVILASRRLSELKRVKESLTSKKLDAVTLEPLILELDLADLDHMESFVQKVYDECGHIDILINNGGVSFRGSILHTKIDIDQKIMNINYFGTIALTKAVLPKMVQRKKGHIVFMSSVQGLITIPDRACYAASKHALQAFGDTLRSEVHQHNIKVSVISPGYIKTAVSLNALTGSGDLHGVMDKSTAAGYTADYAAEKFLDSIVKEEKEIILCQSYIKVGIFLRHFSPCIFFWFVAKRALKT